MDFFIFSTHKTMHGNKKSLPSLCRLPDRSWVWSFVIWTSCGQCTLNPLGLEQHRRRSQRSQSKTRKLLEKLPPSRLLSSVLVTGDHGNTSTLMWREATLLSGTAVGSTVSSYTGWWDVVVVVWFHWSPSCRSVVFVACVCFPWQILSALSWNADNNKYPIEIFLFYFNRRLEPDSRSWLCFQGKRLWKIRRWVKCWIATPNRPLFGLNFHRLFYFGRFYRTLLVQE